ncbi:MAG TPA: hypothetical protein PLS58_07900 [Bacteroidales bacterium]|nr:hypothetical protein [Bacteroidales bacterium]
MTTSPCATAPERPRLTLVPETATLVTDLGDEFTITVNAEAAGMMPARDRLKVMSSLEGVAFSTDELT